MKEGAVVSVGRVIRARVTAARISPRETGTRRTSSCIESTEGASSTACSAPRTAPVVCSTIASSSAWLG
jgi:hypothetical protein